MTHVYRPPFRPSASYSIIPPAQKRSRAGTILWVGFWCCLAAINLTVLLTFWPSDSEGSTRFHFGARPSPSVSPVQSALELSQSLQQTRPKSPPAPSARTQEIEETLTAWFDSNQR